MGPPSAGVPGRPRARPCPCRSLIAPLGCSAVARLQRWFRGLIAAEGPVGGGSLSISSVYMFSITFTHLTELLALGGRRSEALLFVRVNVPAVARLRRERAQTSIIRNMFDVKATSDDDTCIHAMDHAHGDPQQTSRRRLGPLRHRSVPASPCTSARRSDAETRRDGSLRVLQGGRRTGSGWYRVRRSKTALPRPKVARTAHSRAPSRRHRNTRARRGARERSLHACGGRERRGGGLRRVHAAQGTSAAH